MVNCYFEEDGDFSLMEYYNPFISEKERKLFFEYIGKTIKNALSIITENHGIEKEFYIKALNLARGTLDYEIYDYIYEKVV